MAKGADSEEFLLMSELESASGFKRDLSAVLNNQADSPSSLIWPQGKTNGIILEYSRKRFKKSSCDSAESQNKMKNTLNKEESLSSVKTSPPRQDELQGNAAKPSIEEEPVSASLEDPCLMEAKSNALGAPLEDELTKNLVSPMNVEDDGTNTSNIPCAIENQNDLMISSTITEEPKSNDEKVMHGEARSRRHTRSAVKSNESPLVVDGGNATKEAKNVDVKDFRDVVVCLRSVDASEETRRLFTSSTMKPQKLCTQSTLNLETEPLVISVNSTVHNPLLEESPKKLSDSELKVPTVHSDHTDADAVSQRESDASALEHEIQMLLLTGNKNLQEAHKIGEQKDSSCARQVRPNLDSTIMTGDSKEVHYASADKPRMRFTRSALNTSAQTEIVDASSEVQNILELKSKQVLIDEIENTSPSKSSCIAKIEYSMADNNKKAQDASKLKPKRFSRIARECMTEPRGVNANSKVHNVILDMPVRRFTRSTLVCKEEAHVMDEVSKVHINSPKKAMRRFTRSALNFNNGPTEVSAASISSGSPSLLETVDQNKHTKNCLGRATDAVSQIITPPHKKLEMKMSKKIALKKFPTKINELLETGMLEGLSVKYVCRAEQSEVLQGMIKDCGILCSCTLCKGCKVVTATEFERHAGSTYRNAAHYIYMDNGRSLYDVLSACRDAPLDMLEATIQMAIKSPAIRNSICQNCKRPTKTRRKLLLCNSCLELKKSHTSPEGASHTVARSKKLSITKESDDVPECISPQSRSSRGKLTRKDLRLHKLVFEKDGLPDGTELAYYVRGQKLLEGYKKGFGIFCFCCNSEISPSQFEAHAGWATRRKPYLHIYTSNGVSLHELSISLSKGRKLSAKDNDDLCGICADFGDLLLCDGCPRAFHKDCIGEPTVPRGKWYCPYCQNVFQKDQACAHNANAVAAGRISGVDPIEQITKRCIRIVKTSEVEVGGCTLCRILGFSKSGFGPRTIILCDQCEKEFHVGCLRDHKIIDLKKLPKGKWFCSNDCSRINSVLEKLLVRGPEELPHSITKSIKMKMEESSKKLEISWRLLSGKVASPESRSLLSKAVAIFHNRFDPIVDTMTGRDLIPCMVYGRSIRDQEFGGMFCAVLTVNSSVVSAGLLRVLGQELAELPLVATSSDHQGQGYFQALFSCIERLLGFLNVKNLVLPAAEEAEAIWTDKFGFRKLTQDQMGKYTKDYQMTVFRETPVLYKPVPKCRIVKGS